MIKILGNIFRGFGKIAFPDVCVCCGNEHTLHPRQLCPFCLNERFDDANPENEAASGDTLLPEGVIGQLALWNFDKGGDLQHLLHQLKYQRLTAIGIDLGRKMGERFKKHPLSAKTAEPGSSVIVPVPLHYLRLRYRGFNQAFKIAAGFQEVWPGMDICDIGAVVRSKNTQSQTGFSLQKRMENLNGAFKVRDPRAIRDKYAIVIDDVFTTGATTFELAKTLKKAGAGPVIVLTVAQA